MSYEQHRDRAAADQRAASAAGRDCGSPPDVANPKRRGRCERDLQKYLETYHPAAFPLKWGDSHLEAIASVEDAVLQGGRIALAMPRGSGKTTICERACLWALLYGHWKYAFLIGASDQKAAENMASCQIELVCNDLLYEDFPEVCHALRALDWIANRAKGQTMEGDPTHCEWGKRITRCPTVDGRPGAILKAGGLLTAVRGAKHTAADGTVVRPDGVLLDDPQTAASAKSGLQCDERERLIAGDVLGMAGPGRSIGALMACTVIRKGDVADRLLNRELHPEWHGQRTRLMDRFPDRLDLWQQYHEIRVDDLQADGDGSAATRFYRKHRKEMDKGAKVAWKHRFVKPLEISAVQNAMNLWLTDQDSFYSEYQNEPLDDRNADEADVVTPEAAAARVSTLPRGLCPAWAVRLVAYADVQDKLLYYAVVALADDFTGQVVDYGAWPDQKRQYFTLSSAKATLAKKWPKLSKEARIRRALAECFDGDDEAPGLLARTWERDGDGERLAIERAGVDCGYQSDLVKEWIRESPHRARLLGCHGKGVKATHKPFAEWKKKTGDRVGAHWRITRPAGKRSLSHLLIDTNHWKSFLHARFTVAPEERGAWLLHAGTPKAHRMVADHLTAERKQRVSGPERTVDEWNGRPGQDNHLFDCLVGCAVLASVAGCRLPVAGAAPKAKPKGRVSQSRPLF